MTVKVDKVGDQHTSTAKAPVLPEGIPTDEVERAVAIYDETKYSVNEAAKYLGITASLFRKLLDFDTDSHRPRAGSEFPNAYQRDHRSKFSAIRIPESDLVAYKVRQVKGITINDVTTEGANTDDETESGQDT